MVWDPKAIEQSFGSSGSYDANSAIAKEYAGLDEDSSSRVDDGAGWRQIKKDKPPKTAAEYEALVKEYSAAGFDVKAIDMDGENFTNSNIAIKPKDGGGTTAEKDVELSPRLATARARAAQYEEDRVSGQAAKDLYDPDNHSAEGFLDRYKLKLGKRLENGNYLKPDHSSTNSSKVASGENDVSMDASEFSRTGKDNRKGY